MRSLKTALCLPVFALFLATPAFSVTITNQDGEPRQITVTENGARSERSIAPSASIQVCEQGCFITFPDGTLTAYQGNETIVIRNGGPALAN